MRLAEGTIPAADRNCCGVWVRPPAGRQRLSLFAGTFFGALALCAPAAAQEASSEIAERIENTFDLVIGNTAELAIPLTRRALARRFTEGDPKADVPALAYSATSDAEQGADARSVSASTEPVAEEGSAEEGSAEEGVEDADIARVPRSRPRDEAEPEAVADAMGGPLDLVAGAAGPEEEQVAAAPARPVFASDEPLEILGTGGPSAAEVSRVATESAELVASGACLPLSKVTDKDDDFDRNAEILSESGFCITEKKFKERRRPWTIAIVRTTRPGPLFAVMHDDENMSFDTAVLALKTYGGTLIAVETGGKRNQDGIDPNRNFSADGVGCRKLGDDASPKFTQVFEELIDESQPVIALHNNTGKRIPTGGLGHVTMDDVPKGMDEHASNDPDGPLAGDRALVLLTSPVPVSTTSKNQAAALNAKGINAVIEGVRKEKGDCSLSNYTLLTGREDYLNVTVDSDEGDKQQKIIDAIMAGRDETVASQ